MLMMVYWGGGVEREVRVSRNRSTFITPSKVDSGAYDLMQMLPVSFASKMIGLAKMAEMIGRFSLKNGAFFC